VDIDPEQVATVATKFEESLAKLRGEIELAEANPPGAGTTLTPEEQGLYEELASG